jgi:group II intron reverse transcriptase/maturase
MTGTSGPQTISTKTERIAELARQIRDKPLTSLSQHIDVEWLREAYERTRKDGAAGIDGQTMAEYGANLEGNLERLVDRAKSGQYRAPPVRRVHIPKGDGRKTRPIGIPTAEDKVLQRAVAMVLEPVYEQEFLPCSYGFRPGRSAHDALDALWKHTMGMRGGWLLEADIEGFFDAVDHGMLREMLHRRVRDGVVLRLIGKWLNAGVMEAGELRHPEAGTPQGGVISPLLANVYLHEVLDVWFEREVKPRLRGAAQLVRFADDFVIVFALEEDARRVAEVLPKRFEKYKLRLHPDKTRLIEFKPPKGKAPFGGRSFDFLGFRHFWALSWKGNWVVKKKTMPSRLSRALRSINQWCRLNRHLPVREQHKALLAKLRGHGAYYGVVGNGAALAAINHWTIIFWWKWLGRRSDRGLTWEAFDRMLKVFPIPTPRVRPCRP